MRRIRSGTFVMVLVVSLGLMGAGAIEPADAPALVPLPEHVTFVHNGALERVLAGDDQATVLVDPAALPAEDPGFSAPLEVIAHWWAPDGTHVLVGVESTVTGARQLFICDQNGGSPVAVDAASGLFLERGGVAGELWDNPLPLWSPDGQSIALTVFDGDTPFGDIYVVGLDGTSELVGSGVEPAWSPDSARIAYARVVPGVMSLAEARPYVTVGTLGGGTVDLGTGRSPVFSPDGTEVLYRTWTESDGDAGDSEQLAIAPAAGGAERRLTAYGPMDDMGGPSAIFDHRFSPDGSTVYYLLGRRSDSRYVYGVAADGSSAAPVGVSGLATEYTLSLDGSLLIYAGGGVYEASFQTRQQIYARNLASCAEWQLTTGEIADFSCSNLSVSHQDRYVAFDAAIVPAGTLPGEATTREVWVATLDGSHAWRCATDAWDAASQPLYGTSVTGDTGTSDDVAGNGFFEAIGDAIASFFEWLAGLFD
ncbi:MAG: hypothetical protein Q7W51_10205 [Coriobacteriia bacterium]|nr:hypothetical protein [Coriobacteriia bacterium]